MQRMIRRRRLALLAGGAILVGVVVASAAARTPAPQALYKALLTTPIDRSQLPTGLPAPKKTGFLSPQPNPRRYHEAGVVRIDFGSGSPVLYEIEYRTHPTPGDAAGAFANALKTDKADAERFKRETVQQPVPGFPKLSLLNVRPLASLKGTCLSTTLLFASGNVVVNTAVPPGIESSKGCLVPTVTALAQFGLHRLQAAVASLK